MNEGPTSITPVSPVKKGLCGILAIRDGIELDYCGELAIQSMLPVCDEVLIGDGGSTDGTREFFVEWAKQEPKIRVLDYPWPNPVGDQYIHQKWLNWIQQFSRFNMVCTVDADEVFDPSCYSRMTQAAEKQECLWFHRVNLWKDPQHEAPHGTVCGHEVARLGPVELPLVSDQQYPGGEPEIRVKALRDASLRIWHLGFLRDQKKFLKKSRREQLFLLNTYDSRLEQCEKTGEDWVELTMWKDRELIEHKFMLPETIKPWLRERGHSLP